MAKVLVHFHLADIKERIIVKRTWTAEDLQRQLREEFGFASNLFAEFKCDGKSITAEDIIANAQENSSYDVTINASYSMTNLATNLLEATYEPNLPDIAELIRARIEPFLNDGKSYFWWDAIKADEATKRATMLQYQQKNYPHIKNPVPCTTEDISRLHEKMLLGGKHFEPEWGKDPQQVPGYRFKLGDLLNFNKNSLEEAVATPLSNMQDRDINTLVQLPGAGKTRSLFQLGRSKYVIYINMAFDNVQKAGLDPATQHLYKNINDYLTGNQQQILSAASPDYQLKLLTDRNQYVTNEFERLIYAALLIFLAWKQNPLTQNLSKESFWRFMYMSTNSLNDVYHSLKNAPITSLRTFLQQHLQPQQEEAVLAFDEVGSLISEDKLFLPAENLDLGNFQLSNSVLKLHRGRPLFYPFGRALVNTRPLLIHKVICGTTLSTADIIEGNSSIFANQMNLILPIPVLHGSQVNEILKYYFGFELSLPERSEWQCRARVVFECLIKELIQALGLLLGLTLKEKVLQAKEKALTSLKKIVENVIRLYEREVFTLDNHKYSFAELLNKLLCGIVMCDNHAYLSPDASAFIDQGVMMLTKDKTGQVCEPLMAQALVEQLTRGELREDPIIKFFQKKTIEHQIYNQDHGKCWEHIIARFFMVDFTKVASLENSFLGRYCNPDVQHYTFSASRCRSGKSIDDFVNFLENDITQVIFFPDNLAGPDIIFFLHKKRGAPAHLCDYVMVTIQAKAFMSGNLYGKELEHAISTTIPQLFYWTRKERQNASTGQLKYSTHVDKISKALQPISSKSALLRILFFWGDQIPTVESSTLLTHKMLMDYDREAFTFLQSSCTNIRSLNTRIVDHLIMSHSSATALLKIHFEYQFLLEEYFGQSPKEKLQQLTKRWIRIISGARQNGANLWSIAIQIAELIKDTNEKVQAMKTKGIQDRKIVDWENLLSDEEESEKSKTKRAELIEYFNKSS